MKVLIISLLSIFLLITETGYARGKVSAKKSNTGPLCSMALRLAEEKPRKGTSVAVFSIDTKKSFIRALKSLETKSVKKIKKSKGGDTVKLRCNKKSYKYFCIEKGKKDSRSAECQLA